MEFYDVSWNEIGSKATLKTVLFKVTGIDARVLAGQPPSMYNAACRLSWAARRQTTRTEDMAYSLLGLMEVNMPLLYGEGMNAFKRLQEEILKNSRDNTIFAWRDHSGLPSGDGILAPSPANFCIPTFCKVCQELATFTYPDLYSRSFANITKDEVQNSSNQERCRHSSKLPIFMSGRLQMTLPVSYTVNRNFFDPKKDGKTVLIYLGLQTGRRIGVPGALICLELNPDWEDIEDFCRRSAVLLPSKYLACFATEQVVLVAWRNLPAAPGSSLHNSTSARFLLRKWPPCLHPRSWFLHGIPFPPGDVAHFQKHEFDKILPSNAHLVILWDHIHAGSGGASVIKLQFGYTPGAPICNITRDSTRTITSTASLSDRAHTCLDSQQCKILLKIRRMADEEYAMPSFKVLIACEEVR